MYPIISLSESLEIPSFFLVISLVLSVSLFWIVRRGEAFQLPKKNLLDLSLLLMMASLVGARLMHVFHENLDYYQNDPLKILHLWDGGFVFFGGMMMAFVAAVSYLKLIRALNPGLYFDAFAPVLSFAYGFGRIGCFLAGCCFGKECNYFWAVQQRHPTQLYALFWELGSISILLGIEKKSSSRRGSFLNRSGDLFLLWLILHSVGRLVMEHYRDDFRGNEIFGMSVSTFLSFVIFSLASTLLLVRPKG